MSSSRVSCCPGLRTAMRSGRSSHLGWRHAITAASRTAGCAMATFSSAMELIHSPPDFTTSLLRSVILRKPSASMVATSPVGNQRILGSFVIAAHDPRPAHVQVAERFAVPGQLAPVAVDDLPVDAEHDASLLLADRALLLGGKREVALLQFAHAPE